MKSRREMIERNLSGDIKKVAILEIGALDNPTYDPGGFNVKFLDYASTEKLAEKGDRNPRYQIDKIVKVDYVSPGPEYSKVIKTQFDLVVANHVIEHIPDTIRWLDEIYKLLAPGGFLFLSVPDKRYTFDIARNNTTFIEVLRNYDEKLMKPSYYQILGHFYYHKAINAQEAWEGNIEEKLKTNRYEPKKAIEVTEHHVSSEYADVHCHVFTSDSFKEMIEVLTEIGKVNFSLAEIDEPTHNTNEFHALLLKS